MILAILGCILNIGGCWIMSDGLYSIALYLNAPSFRRGEKQSWKKDHSIRLVRIAWGVVFMGIGLVIVVLGVKAQ